jgi:signal transduction histidine kinase
MSAVSVSFSVRPPELLRSFTIRWVLGVSSAFVVCMLLLFGFIYLRTATYMSSRVHDSLIGDINEMIAASPQARLDAIEHYLQQDPRRIKVIGLFDAKGGRIAGNVERLPPEIRLDATTESIVVDRFDSRGHERQAVIAIARKLPDGYALVIGRNVDEIAEVARIIEEALALGVLPATLLAVGVGVLLSIRARRRVEAVTRQVERIVAGELKQRLPTRGGDDPFDRLSVLVNGMLDEIEELIKKVAGVSDNIAHDIRTPLTRARVRLERGRDNAQTLEELRTAVDNAICGLDQSLAVVTALLRIAEIEHSRRLVGFGDVALADLVREVGDMYEPIAEDRHVALRVDPGHGAMVRGDRDLLLEALANLVDNAIKFTPAGGQVDVILIQGDSEDIMRISDTGPGIQRHERDTVLRRFYRSDTSRQTEGLGLGLSLVTAIVKLHEFRLSFGDGPGCIAEIACPRATHRTGHAG